MSARSTQPTLAVMAHPSRREFGRWVLDAVGVGHDNLVLDPYPDEATGALPPFALACGRADPGVSDWHVVLMDDAEPARDFWTLLGLSLADAPTGTLSLYHEWGSRTGALARCAALSGCRYVPVADPYVPTIGIALPASWAREVPLAFPGRQTMFEDVALGRFLATRSRYAYAAVPTLVQHRTLPSLVGHDTKGERKSALFADGAGDGAMALEPEVWPGRYAPYVRYHDLALHVMTSPDGRYWSKVGIQAWLHGAPGQRLRWDALRARVSRAVAPVLVDRDPTFAECECIDLVSGQLALMSMAVADVAGIEGDHVQTQEAALETLAPGTLRSGHEPGRLRGLGGVMRSVLVDMVAYA